MELWNIKNEEFQKNGIKLIQTNGEVLILIRYPYQAGNRDYFIIKSEKDFINFLNERKSKESITLFKSIENVAEGLINEDFIRITLEELEEPKYSDWLTLFPGIKDKNENWFYDETKEDLEESFRFNMGSYVRIVEDSLWLNEELIFHAYVPDEDGEIRPGAY